MVQQPQLPVELVRLILERIHLSFRFRPYENGTHFIIEDPREKCIVFGRYDLCAHTAQLVFQNSNLR
ncbi:CIC11C00000004893 [Sungouiella intermedia]|uniref:CIC11C00000004893 n=1 Tax=Sungouiella intermedia TaxID=45354 RepID=A0A1L0BSJ5_9ASCO|nr:CIC11C00000004893 [[Candida] intermedia]